MSKILGTIILAVFVLMAVVAIPGIFGAADEGVDLTGTDYEDQYDAGTKVAIASTSLMQFVPYVLIFAVLMIGIGKFAKSI